MKRCGCCSSWLTFVLRSACRLENEDHVRVSCVWGAHSSTTCTSTVEAAPHGICRVVKYPSGYEYDPIPGGYWGSGYPLGIRYPEYQGEPPNIWVTGDPRTHTAAVPQCHNPSYDFVHVSAYVGEGLAGVLLCAVAI